MIPSAGFTFIAMKDEKKIGQPKPAPSVVLKVKQGQAKERVVRFTSTFLIGRHRDNDLRHARNTAGLRVGPAGHGFVFPARFGRSIGCL